MTSQLLDRPSASSAEGSLVGSEVPRIWTRPLRELTPKTSLGYSVIEFAEKFLFIELFPWQKWLLIHALELRPNGRLRFRNIIVLVARQNGKSTLSIVLYSGAEVMVVRYDHTVAEYLDHVGVAYERQDRVMPVPFRHSEHTH